MKSKKIKNGFVVVPYAYIKDYGMYWEQKIILSMINGFNRAGKPFINYYPTLVDILDVDIDKVQAYIDELVKDGYLREVKTEGSPIIEYYVTEQYMEV